MISKRIDRHKKTSDFERLGRYVLEAKTEADAILWTRTAEYVMNLNNNSNKVLAYRITNCEAEVPAMAIAEVMLTQSRNTRSKKDKTYHLVISFPDGEYPAQEQLEEIEDTICQALGFKEHQRISAVHQDTDNLHLHLAINKVHPTTHKVLEPYRDYYIRDKTCRELEQRHGLLVDNGRAQGNEKLNNKAAQQEAHTGEQSLLSWIHERLKEPLQDMQTTIKKWDDLHALLDKHGLMIKPRGAGLVIALLDGSLAVKASAVDRGLSLKTLTDRLGVYQPPIPGQHNESIPEGSFYQRGPRQGQPGTSTIWGQYQKEKELLFQKNSVALNALRAEHTQYSRQLKDWYQKRRASIKNNQKLSRKSKWASYKALSQEMKADFSQRKRLEAEQRRAIKAQYPILTWEQWLTQSASQGDRDALGLLRSRERVRKRLAQALLTAEDIEAAKLIVYPQLKPFTRKNGDVVYRLKDGGVVEDSAKAVHVPEITEAASL